MEKYSYTIEYNSSIGKNDIIETTIDAQSINDAIKILVSQFNKEFNIVNIEINAIFKDGIDLGVDGKIDAEVALAKHYL